MSRAVVSRRFNFTVELHAGARPFKRSDVGNLVSACAVNPVDYVLSNSGPVAGYVYFRQWCEACESVLRFWDFRLRGVHSLAPVVKSPVFLPSDREELHQRLKSLFSSRVRDLLNGDSVRRCQKKMESLSQKIAEVSQTLAGHVPLALCNKYLDEKQRLLTEKEMVIRKLEEFRTAMRCVLARFDGEGCPEGEIDVFKFEDDLDWGKIQHIIQRECRRLDESLPIFAHRREILRLIHYQQVLVLIGETGSGKSTQLVQYISDSGLVNGSIVCTQPRKIAARSLTQRVREESYGCYSGNSVICYPTYSSLQGFNSQIVFTTDHCLLQHCMTDANLAGISFIIVDEAHERSLNTDLLLALVKKFLLQRLDLRLIIMSATVDAAKLAEYFFGCDAFHVQGRGFPVDLQYVPNASSESFSNTSLKFESVGCASYVSDTLKVVSGIHTTEEDGAILAFLTSQSEVEWACKHCQIPGAVVLPLHGKLSCEEQGQVFHNFSGKRKIIFATNIAETSLTIPDVTYVVDSGMVKESRFEPGTGMNVLKVCWVSQSSANQRAGRAGRTRPGKCYRLYSELDFQTMHSHQEPEIRKVHLGIAVLRILALGIKKIEDFDFVDAPDPKSTEMAIRNLVQLGAVALRNNVLELTDVGRHLVKLGIEPRLGKLILDSHDFALGREGIILAALMATSSSIFCRVGNEEEKSKADCQKVQFCHQDGDLFTLLSAYKKWEDERQASRNVWCWNNSINAKSMRRCKETVGELEQCLQQELQIIIPSYWKWDPDKRTVYDKTLKKVILSSLAENVAMYSGYERLGYEVALTGEHVRLHPSCSLLIYDQKPSWVVFSEFLSASKQYLVCVTAIDYESLSMLEPPPPFDALMVSRHKMQKIVISGFGHNLLRRFCGKSNNNLHSLIERIQAACQDPRIGIDVNFDTTVIECFASESNIRDVSGFINTALKCEAKWLRDECIEKYLFRSAPGFSPAVALFGAGAEIRHLELDNRFISVEVFHPCARCINEKELLMMFDKNDCYIANFHKYAGSAQENEDSEKWGKIVFLSPDIAERAVRCLNGAKFCGSIMRISPCRSTFVGDEKAFSFPAVKAKVCWPRRRSKGVAIVKCKTEDVGYVLRECSTLIIGGRFIGCSIGRKATDTLILHGLNHDTTEQEIWDALRLETKRTIIDVFLLRGEAVNQPPNASCADALLREITSFMPSKNSPNKNCSVSLLPSEPKDYTIKATVTFDGSLHAEAAKALQHIEGKVLPGCFPWQKIQCQQMFRSSVSCPGPVYLAIKKQLDSLLESFKCRKGVYCNMDRTDNGLYRVKISATGTKIVADVRKPFEQLMKGKTVAHPDLNPSVLHLLFSREGVSLMKTLEKETKTYILHDKQNFNVKIFGSPEHVNIAEQKLAQSLLHLYENKQAEIRLRGRGFPPNLLKEIVQKFGPDLSGLKEKVPDTEFTLDTRRHTLSFHGSKELKKRVEDIVLEVAQSITDVPSVSMLEEVICPICLCNVEECYMLESCGHSFCRCCLVEQCESAIRNREGFPLCCTYAGCKSEILLVDLKALLTNDKLEDFFRASVGAFVASSGGAYRFCPSPDCPAVYKAVEADRPEEQPPFACGACFAETCRKCHLEYHPSVSCERYREFKEDPDSSLHEWRRGKDHVKTCPVCGYVIEKVEGCNHIECKCGRHICWVCLEFFSASDECYGHLRAVHHAII